MAQKRIKLPLALEDVLTLQAGETILLNGDLLSFRDAAHQRLVRALDEGEPLPLDLRAETIYYMGPCPTPPGRTIGSAGPTTSGRMDGYTPRLLKEGIRGMIGKGQRSAQVIAAMRQYGAVYFAALGGAGALIAREIRQAKVIAYPDLGPEAIHRLTVVDLAVIVAVDASGNDLYRLGRAKYCSL